jgi:hypothetical protein
MARYGNARNWSLFQPEKMSCCGCGVDNTISVIYPDNTRAYFHHVENELYDEIVKQLQYLPYSGGWYIPKQFVKEAQGAMI